MPLLLDTTPLPPELAEFQWIDFRGTIGANHSSIDSRDDEVQASAPLPRPMARARWSLPAGLAAVFGIAVFLGLFMTRFSQAPLPDPTLQLPGPTPLPPPPPAETFDFVLRTLLLLGVGFALTVCLVWLLRRRSKRVISVARTSGHPGDIERHIAGELEAEILRRTALRRDGEA